LERFLSPYFGWHWVPAPLKHKYLALHGLTVREAPRHQPGQQPRQLARLIQMLMLLPLSLDPIPRARLIWLLT